VAGSYVPRLIVSNSTSPAAEVSGDVDLQPWHDKDGRAVGHAYVSQGIHVIELDGVARFAFGPGASEVLATAAPGAAHDLIEEYFRRWILPVAVQVRGLEVLHASAVLSPRGVGAFTAASEAGKSTLAFGLHERGYGLWTDDALAFDVSSSGPHTYPLPFRLRLRPASATHFGLPPRPDGTIAAESDTGLEGPEPIAALFLLERRPSGPAVQIERADPLAAFPTLVEGSYHFGREEGERKRAMLSRYLKLATAVPVHRLTMATGLANLDEVLDAVEERL
jgi:hypothetical protein